VTAASGSAARVTLLWP